jgi:hypothetical protein
MTYKEFSDPNISSYKTRSACGTFFGLSEVPIEGIHLSDIPIEMDKTGKINTPAMIFDDTKLKKGGFVGSNMRNSSFRNVNITGLESPAIKLTDLERIEISGLNAIKKTKSSTVKTKNCRDVHISASRLKDSDVVSE